MKKVHILTAGFTSPNGIAFLFPLIKFKKHLKNAGFDIQIRTDIDETLYDCDILCIESKYFKDHWAKNFDGTLEQIKNMSGRKDIYWFDQSDSTGTLLGQVLPFVKKYLKAQIIKDTREYMREHYASRIFADYYHHKHGITDKDDYLRHTIKNVHDLEKISFSWNSGLMNYGWVSPYLMRILQKAPLPMFMQFSRTTALPAKTRPKDLACRMGISYSRETICFQRRTIKEKLKDRIPTKKISRRAYLQEIADSKICISPFGLGEITLKDFEAFLRGSMLLKPDMSHMQTWPNFFEKDKTYLAHGWDIDDLEEKIEWALRHENKRLEIAEEGQARYIRHTIGPDAGVLFAQHFKSLFDL